MSIPFTISFTKVRLPFGWLGNMSPYPVRPRGSILTYPTAEHLFQAMRFSHDDLIREEIRSERSPMAAKMIARKHDRKMVIEERSPEDLRNMGIVLQLKIEQHPELVGWLLDTGNQLIVEDVTSRQRGAALFWGAARDGDGDQWRGENHLGLLWMDLRKKLRAAAAGSEEVKP